MEEVLRVDVLEADGFVEMANVLAPSAVYCLLWQGEVVYVGQSKNLYNRLAWHRNALVRRKRNLPMYGSPQLESVFEVFDFDGVWVRWCHPAHLDKLEMEYIRRFKPKHNVIVRSPVPELPIDIYSLARRAGIEGIERPRRRV